MWPLLGGAQVWGFVMLAPREALLACQVGVGGISLSLEELSHQLAGFSTERSNPSSYLPTELICVRTHMGIKFNSIHTHVGKFSVPSCTLRTL